jgi:3-isopropylmalate/(R)-2-methylmalate dehydratase large subunit
MEFTGSVIEELSMAERFTMANMAVEAGAKNGIFAVDKKTISYIKKRAKRKFKVYASTPDAKYTRIEEYDITHLEPQVAVPHLPSNVKPVTSLRNVRLDQVVIGSCTNGRFEDLQIAAQILKAKKVYPGLRLIIIPATPEVYRIALKRGLIDIFLRAGAVISPPTCGPCLGGHMGILAKGERALATTNRNFVGRMGHPGSEVYLSSPAVAAASAIKGRIAHPGER